MKLKYIIPFFIAAVGAVFTGCSDDNDPTYLSEIRVSSSYVALSTSGGSTQIDVQAAGSWSFSEVPEWLTISPSSGSGNATVTFSADAAEGRSAEVLLNCDGKTQRINVIQGLATVAKATCAEVINGIEGKTYRVTGTCVRIANTSYGNWYLNDGTGEIYVYGTVNSGGSYAWSSFGIDAGDVVTVEGPMKNYNGTIELVDATFISVQKSLVKIEEGGENAFDANGGDFTVKLTVNGDGPLVEISDEGKTWLGVTSIVKGEEGTTDVTIHVAPNAEEKARTANISFTSSKGSTKSTVSASVSQMGLSGTLSNPFNVADAIAYCQTLSGATANDFYVKGKISRIANNGEFGSYGNATFFISDDGEFLGEDDKNPDKAHDFEAYCVLFFGNEKWTEGHANISVGDEVVICGKLTLYNGISETSSGNAYIYSINGVTTDANGLGSLAAPFNIAGAINFIDNGGQGDVFVQGIVSEIANNGQFGAQYGNGTFWISDDGVRHNDAVLDFEAYHALWLGNRKWVDGDDPIAVGDKVILHGQLTKYGSTYETSSGKAYVYSVNGKTE